ncbi:DNA-processing protein DprA [uncultured Ruminococcus sp.]|uniref:DNA-processing protein DprA n=1 Tax=uncultured Ruminococcus sp. TaxID=165186 RepID=UPI0025F5F920|nr:DNA-processing protein DprA [uncultured Ruminococcus sp.]
MEEIRCLLWLGMVFGAGSPRIWKALHRYGSPQKAVEVLQKPESDAALHLPEHTLRRIRQTGEAQVEEMLARCEKLRLSILWYGDEAYPPQLLSIVNPPVLLFYQGDSSLLQEHLLLTIVGTRNPSPYSLQVEKTICHDLVQMGFVPVTGYAVGIDITANRCALEADKPSIALMGCGLDVAYPQPHANLKYEIARRGLILSEFLPGTSPAPSNFPLRNRVLSGLSMGTFVIQAPARSGALITAENAMEQGRDVFCIPPADIFDKRYMGVIKYLRDGAIPVFDSRDIVYEYYTSHAHMIGASALYDETREKSESSVMTLGESDAVQQPSRRKQRPPEPKIPEETEPDPAIDPMPEEELEGLAGEILSLLQRQRVMHMDQIAAELEVSMEELTTTLTELELYGKLERLPGKQFRRMR